jgi:two-component system NtrC family sensor kinase
MSWWRRLGVRLAATVVFGAVATIALLAWLVLGAQERSLVDRVTRDAALLSDTIKNSTYHAMLEDRRSDAYRAMESIGRQPGIDRVRFFNKEGRITFSTAVGEANTFVNKTAEACYACHAAGRPLERLAMTSRSRVFGADGHRVLGMVTPIYNEPSCSTAACHAHPPDRTVLGVLDIGISLEPVDTSLALLRRETLVISGLSVLLLASVVTWMADRSVVRPVRELLAATRRMATGDMTSKVREHSSTELGDLQHSFNEMAQALGAARAERLALLQSLEQKVEERTAELKRAQTQLVRSEKLSSLGRLAASVAHEINNPLAGILTYAKLLTRTLEPGAAEDPQKASAVKHLALVKRETERCSAIVRNLLDFARERPLKLVDTDLRAVVDEALTLVSNQARLQNVQFERDLARVPPVFGDFGQLRQACINVIINACDAMKHGGQLRIALAEDGEQVRLSFTDTGTGIPPEYLAKVLDPFFTTKEKGTGLGLSVVYGIVERHGGTVELSSTVGVGTTVTLRLPNSAVSTLRKHEEAPLAAQVTPADRGTGAARTGLHAS